MKLLLSLDCNNASEDVVPAMELFGKSKSPEAKWILKILEEKRANTSLKKTFQQQKDQYHRDFVLNNLKDREMRRDFVE
jgi:hypothetical protein